MPTASSQWGVILTEWPVFDNKQTDGEAPDLELYSM